eukprot:TRINITY_DN1387_c1_g1_i1.p1 TRINITY_DN1387_c1_g1~~TRINITY_DN1387_c1_g1_i1.p1  ORF type:complete len:1128 (-),score=342.35 TRINITY_DN1387_c1_g1_i1:272-3655(-)
MKRRASSHFPEEPEPKRLKIDENMSNQHNTEFDENKANKFMDLYSRQIGAYGVETMKSLSKLSVLVVGVKGVGVETAKNLVLAGPQAVTVYDNNNVTIADLGTNFFFNSDSIGKKRSESCIKQLKLLNPYVSVNAHTGDLDEEFLNQFGAIVVTDETPYDELVRLNNFCRSVIVEQEGKIVRPATLFLVALTNGAAATLFSDFGPVHKVTDKDGENARVVSIDNIAVSKDEQGKAYLEVTVSSAKHGFDDDQLVTFSEVDGMTGINTKQHKVKRVYKKTKDDKGKDREILILNKFHVQGADDEDLSQLGEYKSGGIVTEVKSSVELKFRTLSDAVLHPLTETDMGFVNHPHQEKLFGGRGGQLHFARLALWQFQKKHGHLPELHSEKDADELVVIAKEILENHKKVPEAFTVEEIDANVVKKYSLYARTELPGLTAFLGGVIAQEVVKKFGKFSPIHQWIHVDYFELLSETVPHDAKPVGSRYDHQISVFGQSFQDKISTGKWFMVGCGALGCEYLKGFSLMGLGTKGGGVLYVTDMDTIEVSNLSRQFLFRKENVGQHKSVCAAAAARMMNPEMNIVSYDVPVGPDTENKFDEEYWSGLDGVCNALDNIKAREYTDSKCVMYQKPLLESGTLGTKANSEIILPFKTKSYSDHEKIDEDEAIPMCTLRNFPHLIEHCIEWARAIFSDVFVDPPSSFNNFVKNKEAFYADVFKSSEGVDLIQSVLRLASKQSGSGASFKTCLELAFDVMIGQFRDRILNLIHAFPENSEKEDKDKGIKVPFWSGSKRFPRAISYDPNDKDQFSFMYNTANLFAVMFKLPPVRGQEDFRKELISANLNAPQWKPDSKFMAKVQNEVKEEESKKDQQHKKEEEHSSAPVSEEDILNKHKSELEGLNATTFTSLEKADFEKDDDTNFHIDFITACANMRAWNYHIKSATRHKCKMIAGRIIPAIATTTAMITGLVELEFYKILLGLSIDKFCNSNVNLGISEIKLFEPIAPKKKQKEYDHIEMEDVIPVPEGWTVWDQVIIQKDMTVQELIDQFPTIHHGCTVETLISKSGDGKDNIIWTHYPFGESQKAQCESNKSKSISQIYETYNGPLGNKKFVTLVASVKTTDGHPASIPPIRVRVK